MKRDGRLSGVLHVLLHLARRETPATSEALAKAVSTHPVVIRRIMAGLRDHGYVRSEKGHGGGWSLACDLSKVTLRDIYMALGRPSLFAIGHRTETPSCRVERAVDVALDQSLEKAEAVLLTRFGEVTLAALDADVRRGRAARGRSHHLEKHHA